MSAGKGRGSLALRPPTLRTESKSVVSGLASVGKRSVQEGGGRSFPWRRRMKIYVFHVNYQGAAIEPKVCVVG